MATGQKVRNSREPQGGGGQNMKARKDGAKEGGTKNPDRESEIRGEPKNNTGRGNRIRGG